MMDENSSERPIRLITKVELSEDLAPQLIVYQDDAPEQCVKAFCEEHGLGDDVVAPLLEHVMGELQKADEAAAEAESSETGARAPSEKGGKEETRKHRKKKPNAFSRLYDEAGEVRRRHEERVMAAEREREEAIQRSRPSAKPNKSNLATSSRAEPRGDHLVDRLYRQGIQQRAIRTLEYEAARAAREEQLMSEYTFKPTISSRALEGTQKSTGWQRLWDNAQSRQAALQERQRQRQEEKAAKEAAACKFKPSIDPISRKMASQRVEALRENNITVFDQLTQDAERRRMRTEQYQSFRPGEATFQPQIDENSRMLALKNARPTSTMSQFNAPHVAGIRGDEPNDANLSSHDIEAVGSDLMSESDEDDVVDRLQARDEERRRRIEAAQKEKEKLQVLDPSTGKPLFRPSILTQDLPEDVARAVEERQGERAGMSIGEFLYQKGLDKLREKELAAARTEKPAVRYMSKQSKEYLAKLRLRRFEQIFDYMVENQGGGEEVNVAALLERGNPVLDSMDPEVRADVEEACKIALAKIQHAAAAARRKLRAGEAPMGLETFVEAMADAIDAAPGQRTYLLPVARVRAVDQNMTFKPKVSQKSVMLARQQRRPEGTTVFDMLIEEGKAVRKKKDELRERLEQERMQGCSFKPQINPSSTMSRILRSSYGPGPAPGVPRKVYNAVAAPSMKQRAYEDVDQEVTALLRKEAQSERSRRPHPHPIQDIQGSGRMSEDDMLNFGGLDGEGGADALLESLRSQLGNLRQEEEEAAGGPRMAWAE